MNFAHGRRARLRAGAAAVAGAIGGSLVAAGPAQAVVPACGTTITTSIVLTGDMLNCPGTALRVNASNVVIDLNGHTLDGPGATLNGSAGVLVAPGITGVTVKNGHIQEFAFGVGLANNVSGSDVSGLDLVGNGGGVVTVTTVQGVASVTNNNHVHANSVAGNSFQGISMLGSGNWVESNDITANSSAGLRIANGDDNLVENNRLTRDRMIVNNATNTVVRNNETNGAQLTGILVVDSPNTTVSTNQSSSNGDGIGVQGNSSGTVVSGNTAFANTDDGIDVSATGVTVTANTAYQNRDYGISAVAGTIDGGANKAFANGNPQQCTPNIVCT